MKEKKSSWVTTGLFLSLTFGITAVSLFHPVKKFSENENRVLAQKPRITKETLLSGELSKEYEAFITDQFPARDTWIEIKTQAELMMGHKEVNGVYFAKDGYLLEKHTAEKETAKQRKKNIKRVKQMADYYERRLGSGHVKVMLVPSSTEILAEKLPFGVEEYNESQILDQVERAVSKEVFVNPTPILDSHKEEYIYYRTDHHWTSLGAYYAYTEWAQACGFLPISQKEFKIKKANEGFYGTIYSKVNKKGIKPDVISLYERKKRMNYQVDYDLGAAKTDTLYSMRQLKGKDKYAVFLDGNHAVVTIDTNVKNDRRLLIIKDSFAHSFAPFAVNHFSQTHMLDFRYVNIGIKDYIRTNKITDILLLYSAVNFEKDTNTRKLIQ